MRRTLLTALCAICAACSPGGEEPPELTTTNTISFNSLAPAQLADNGVAVNALAAGPLAGAATDLVDTEDGSKVLSYVVRCALSEGESAVFSLDDGGTVSYDGVLGFAPAWAGAALDATGKRWMSACLLAHVNAFSIAVPISVRAWPKGEPSLEESTSFEVQEAAFYGDIFAEDPANRHMHACFGYHVAALLGYDGDINEDSLDYLQYRVCATEEEQDVDCGFVRTGACFNWGPPIEGVESRACDTNSGNFYLDCHDRPIGEGETVTWPETVTVHLLRADFDRQMEEYLEAEGCTTDSPPCEGGPFCASAVTCNASDAN